METKNVCKTIAERIAAIAKQLEVIDRCLLKAPNENISIKTIRGKTRYYARRPGETNGRYLGPGCEDEIRSLERKAYYIELRQELVLEKRLLEDTLAKLRSRRDANEVYEAIAPERRNLIEQFKADDDGQARLQLAMIRKGFLRSSGYATLGGERVLSKSEVMIADRVRNSDSPYVYEPELALGEHGEIVVHPDFAILNRRTGELWFWEHFGMMGDSEYAANATKKLEDYADAGLVPGKGLIVTMESRGKPLSTDVIDAMIEAYLL